MEGSRVTRTGIGCQSQTTGESESIRAGSVRVSKKRKVEVTIGSTFDRIRGEKLRFDLFLWFFSLTKLDFDFVVSRNLVVAQIAGIIGG